MSITCKICLSIHVQLMKYTTSYSVKKYLSFSLHKCITKNKHALFHLYQLRVMIHFTFSPPLAALARLSWQRWISTPGATSNEIVAMEKRYYCEIIAFLSRRYYRFLFVLPSDFDNIFFMILDGNYSATVAISLES